MTHGSSGGLIAKVEVPQVVGNVTAMQSDGLHLIGIQFHDYHYQSILCWRVIKKKKNSPIIPRVLDGHAVTPVHRKADSRGPLTGGG